MNNLLEKSSYFYNLPEELIAQTPIEPRDSSRLLIFDENDNSISHKHFYNIIDYLNKGDVLVVNDTKVIPARLFAIKEDTKAKIQVFLLKKLSQTNWEVLFKPAKRVSIGTKLIFNEKLYCECIKKLDDGICEVKFFCNGIFEEIIADIGEVPLPPYIHQKIIDKNRYQTVYSKREGSSAAPTAGLHFTNELLQKIEQKGIIIAKVLLTVGLGTFRPVKENNILNHLMHSEHIEITKETANTINLAKQNEKNIVAVGTTSVRVLESCCNENGVLSEFYGDTNIFIYPSYKFKVVDKLITNFHLPESTLIMLVSAFCGYENTMNVYNVAVKEKYRFFSFGDSCLFIKKKGKYGE